MKKTIALILKIFIFVLLILISAFALFIFYFQNSFAGKVLPNVFFDNQKMTGKTLEEISQIVSAKKESYSQNLNLQYDGKENDVSISSLGFVWDENKTITNIMNIGRSGNYINNFFSFFALFISRYDVSLQYDFDSTKAQIYLNELASSIDKEPVDAQFEVVNKKVKNFAMGSDGQKLIINKSIQNILSAIKNSSFNTNLIIEVQKAKGTETIEQMGIKELVATGQSSFAGSPPNRIHNITVGSQVFNGVLIAPGENFSFISALGDVSAKTGYLPELVIKEDKTIPEYGGGLCQVSTTFFRAAINAGFPIIERTAHAYRVFYYEPAGFDSTIYDPKPDLVFQNNTAKYILVQTRISGTDLYVDFYGTNDGRKVEVSKSIVYNLVAPGDPILIETTDLKLGEKKQTDTAHTGADAYFTRKITYADGKVKDDRFDSHYIPWRAKFLVGKEPDKVPDATTPSGNPTISTPTTNAPNNNQSTVQP